MKQIFSFSLLAAVLIFATSCSHSGSSTGNSWSYYGQTYNVVSSSRAGSIVTFTSTSAPGTLALSFFNNIPASAGTYTVVNGTPTAANQVSLTMSPGSVPFYSTGLHHESVAVTVASSGKLSASIPTVQIADSPFFTDSTTMSGNVSEP